MNRTAPSDAPEPADGRFGRIQRSPHAARLVLALAIVGSFALAQPPAPWSLLQDDTGLTYVSTADAATALPRPGENGEAFFLCDQGSLFSGAIVDAGPSDPTAVEAFLVGDQNVAATGGEGGYYLFDSGVDAALFDVTAGVIASMIREGMSLSGAPLDSIAIQAVSGGTAFPTVTAQTGAAFAQVLAQLECVDASFAEAAPATSDDPVAAAPPPAPPPATPGRAPSAPQAQSVPSGGDAFAALLTAGGEVRLPAGTFTLPYDVVPSDDLRLIGAGIGATTLRMPAIEISGLYVEDVDLTMQGMTIVVDGPAIGAAGDFGDAIASFGGDLILRDVAIVNTADHGELGISGVTLLSGSLSATDLLVEGFPFAGVYLEGGIANLRDVTLRANRNGAQLEGFDLQPYGEFRDVTLVDNEWAGIAVYNEASALVAGGTISGNASEATFVSGNGSLTLEELAIENHGSYGVVAEGGRVVVRNATFRNNANAIWALLDSTVSVERSDILGSRAFAVAGNGTGTTTLRRVTVDGSEASAIHAEEARGVVVESSLIRNAGEAGVNLVGEARGEVRDSRIENAGGNGIEARDASALTVVNTAVAGSAGFGIVVAEDATHELLGVTYEANAAGSFQLPGASAAAPPPSETQPARPSRPSRSGAGTPAPSTPPVDANGAWQLGSDRDLMFYEAGSRGFGFVCGFSDRGDAVVYLSLPDLSIASNADDIATFDFARADGTLGTASWNFLDLGDGLYVTDDVASDDIIGKLLPDEGSTQWNTVVVGVPGRGAVLSVPGEALVAELFVQLTCAQ